MIYSSKTFSGKKYLILLLFILVSAWSIDTHAASKKEADAAATLQDDHYNKVWKKRKKYTQIGFLSQSLKIGEQPGMKWNSQYGFALTQGRTYYLHKKPLANMMKFGLDVGFGNIHFTSYKNTISSSPIDHDFNYGGYLPPIYIGDDEEYEDEKEKDLGTKQINIGIQVGPSFTINPVDQLKIAIYCRYSPSGSILIANNSVGGGYASFVNYGLSIAYKVISIGVEGYTGNSKFKHDGLDQLSDLNNKIKFKTKGVNAYIALRF